LRRTFTRLDAAQTVIVASVLEVSKKIITYCFQSSVAHSFLDDIVEVSWIYQEKVFCITLLREGSLLSGVLQV
jgi:hypothetical protein